MKQSSRSFSNLEINEFNNDEKCSEYAELVKTKVLEDCHVIDPSSIKCLREFHNGFQYSLEFYAQPSAPECSNWQKCEGTVFYRNSDQVIAPAFCRRMRDPPH